MKLLFPRIIPKWRSSSANFSSHGVSLSRRCSAHRGDRDFISVLAVTFPSVWRTIMPRWQEQRHFNRWCRCCDRWKALQLARCPWRAITTANVNIVIAIWKGLSSSTRFPEVISAEKRRSKARNFRNISRDRRAGKFLSNPPAEFRAISNLFFFFYAGLFDFPSSFRTKISFFFFFLQFLILVFLLLFFFVSSFLMERRSIRRFLLYQREYGVFLVWWPTMDRVREFFPSIFFLPFVLERIGKSGLAASPNHREFQLKFPAI